jgi:uncharacterized protein (DUF362 family)
MKRRDFIKKSGQALALAAITGATGFHFHNRIQTEYKAAVPGPNGFEVPFDPAFPSVTLARSENHAAALRMALDAIGGIQRFVKPGEKITIKPNIGWDRTPAQAADTNPLLVGEMVRQCLAAGASEVIISDIPCNDARRTFIRSGIKDEAEKAGARVILPVDEDLVNADLGGELLGVWPVLRYFIETDRFINMPIVKQHSLSSVTIALKNLYGILGGRRSQLHQQIDQALVDLASFVRPTLTVVDATRVLMRGGPQGGSLADVRIENSVICSTDQVAADSRAVEFLGLRAEDVGHIRLAEKSGLGHCDYRLKGYKEIS